ncbi:NB-ARC domain-containing protein [Heracleum sosnowskyi]|uniref:NB-ARC domain-containing protein n=1 Tax=Heracleum sosnowskyi TaxID=360622 RepID=A0AAD8IHR8_9APIA|nr:NB-ARC domain-containing protein [Heracleum sosnowskyi]
MADTVQAVAGTVQAVAAVVNAGAEVSGIIPVGTFLSPENVKDMYKELKEQLDSLRAKKKDCDDEAEEGLMTMKTSYDYNDWNRRVTETDFQVTDSLLSYATEIKNIEKWKDVLPRMNLGAIMKNDIKKIKQLKKELTTIRNILVAKQADRVVKISSAPDINGFETLENPMNIILNLLKLGKEVKGIQIHGILGTGKTTIMQNLNNHKEVANMFQIVIWLKASSDKLDAIGNKKNFSIEELQRDVMQRLNLDGTVNQYRQKIWGKLKDKKYLLLLDNVKEDLILDEIGFPSNWERGSKIVLTTRFKVVCPSIVDHSIRVGILTPKEARRMFISILKPKDFSDNTFIMRIIRKVVDWCRGLPVAIKIVAGYFRLRDSESSWRNGFNTLISWPEYGDDKIKEMCRSLSFCCDYLKGDEKDCFYYGALYPEESDIYKDRLLDCWMAENFLGNKGERGRAYGRCILERFNDLNLFEEDERKLCVRMHKLIRLMALHNLQTDGKHKCLIVSNEESLDQQSMDKWKEKHWISLADNKNLKTFSDTPDCSMLSTLFLQGNSNLKEIPALFFKEMGSLCVLDLMATGIESLPNSLMYALNLEVLYLNGCTNLMELPIEIGSLELLEVLDISGSGIKNVPPQIQSLKRLKRFLVSSGAFSETNIFNVIPVLTELQEMLIDTNSDKEFYNWAILDAVMESVKTLRHMTSLQFRFLKNEIVDVIKVVDGVTRIYAHKEDNLRCFVDKDEGLVTRSFQVFIGCPISLDVKIPKCEKFQRYVKYCNGKDRSPMVVKLLSKADSLVIDNHYDLEHLSEFEVLNSFSIKGCLLEHCNRIKYIVGHFSMLSKLERLYLNDLLELESLWGGSIHLNNLPKLKTLRLSRCPKLIKIITQDAVKDIIQISQNAGQKPLVFPNLKEVILVEMANLTSICENELLDWPALKTVRISKCPVLRHLPFCKDNAIKLTSITAEETWWDALQWTNHDAKQHFQKHCIFAV